MEDFPLHFRCPISMEIMKDPVIICTGVTYERKNIEKWIFRYKKKTCPATMQIIENSDFTPNHTLKRLIVSWQDSRMSSSSSSSPSPLRTRPSSKHDELVSLLNTMGTSPFKVSSLKKIRQLFGPSSNENTTDNVKSDFVHCGGVESLVSIIVQILSEGSDFVAFRACEEALGVLNQLPIIVSDEEDDDREILFRSLSKPEVVMAMVFMLQRGSAEARSHTIDIFKRMIRANYDWTSTIQDQGVGFFKPMLELISDEICSKTSSCALEVLINILKSSKKTRLKAIESGAVCVLIELLPHASRSRCEKVLFLIKLLCECAEGRQAFVDHGLGIAVVSKKMLRISDMATFLCVKILWLISNFFPTERVLQEMLVFGSVKKLLALLHVGGGGSSTKEKVVSIFKLHGNSWRRYPCFPAELKDYLGLPSE